MKLPAAIAFLAMFVIASESNAECAAEIDGQNVDAMIEQAGGIDPILDATNAQLAEFDKWFEQMQPALNSGIRQAEIQEVYAQGIIVRDQNAKLRDALICRKGG